MISDQILNLDNVLGDVTARSKKHALEILSELLARGTPAIPGEEIFARLIERERLGSTGLGNGVGFPHCRFAGIDSSHGALLRLSEAVEFDAPDGEQVDLVFGLMVPEEITDRHREEIGEISTLLNDPDVRSRLRAAPTPRGLYEVLVVGPRAGAGAGGALRRS